MRSIVTGGKEASTLKGFNSDLDSFPSDFRRINLRISARKRRWIEKDLVKGLFFINIIRTLVIFRRLLSGNRARPREELFRQREGDLLSTLLIGRHLAVV